MCPTQAPYSYGFGDFRVIGDRNVAAALAARQRAWGVPARLGMRQTSVLAAMCVVALSLAAGRATAQGSSRWRTVAQSDVAQIDVDTTTMTLRAGMPLLWVRVRFSKSQRLDDGVLFASTVDRALFDCSAQRMATLLTNRYDQRDALVKSYDWSSGPTFAETVPDTIGEMQVRAVCRPNRGW